jgi:type IV secretory pathway VirB10-like protein
MFSRPLAFVLLALGCVTAAAGGAYVATRHNSAEPPATVAAPPSAAVAPAAGSAQPSAQPVAETEAAVTAKTERSAAVIQPAERAEPAGRVDRAERPVASNPRRQQSAARRTAPAAAPANADHNAPATQRTVPMTAPAAQPEPQLPPVQAPPQPAADLPRPPVQAAPAPEEPRVPQFEDVILPASSVIGLQLETHLSSERARVEDRVNARVTRDVLAAGRVAIPAGSRVLGSVTVVDKGGKVKGAARLGIRFHTLILTDGNEVPLQTEAIYREGESPSANSAKKIGVAAVGGAILGGILGGGKGAVIGGTTGAAGGTASVMAGDRNAVTVAPGTIVTAKLSSPATITVERRE